MSIFRRVRCKHCEFLCFDSSSVEETYEELDEISKNFGGASYDIQGDVIDSDDEAQGKITPPPSFEEVMGQSDSSSSSNSPPTIGKSRTANSSLKTNTSDIKSPPLPPPRGENKSTTKDRSLGDSGNLCVMVIIWLIFHVSSYLVL